MKVVKDKHLVRNFLQEALADVPRVSARCRHFGACGGCDLQNIPYESQVVAKRQVLQRLIEHEQLNAVFAGLELETVASPQPFGYRQRMDYVFAFDRAGLRQARQFRRVEELSECPLLGDRGFAAFARARDEARRLGLESYNFLRHTGFLRYFVIRQTRLGQVLVSLVTSRRDFVNSMDYLANLLIAEGLAHSVHWLLQEGKADVSFGPSIQSWGAELIQEEILGQRFAIGPNTFFQANPWVAELAFGRIRAYASQHAVNAADATACDLYSGTAVIAILLHDLFGQVQAVEESAENERLARQNLDAARASNVTWTTTSVEKFLSTWPDRPDFLVLNPPRAGLGPDVATAVRARNIPALAYMSCNPLTLLRDLKILCENYEVVQATVFDMFPQTKHFETLLCLRARAHAQDESSRS